MTPVSYDPATGSLRLSADTFEALVGTALGTPVAAADRRTLVDAGVLTGSGPHEMLVPGLSAIAGPLCQLQLWITGGFGDQMHQGWLAPEVAAMLLAVEGTDYSFVTLTPEHVPAAIATVTRIGPRARWDEPMALTEVRTKQATIERLLSDDTATRRAAAANLAASVPGPVRTVAESLRSGAWRAWHAEMIWPAPGGDIAGRSLIVLDTDAGLLLCEPGDSATAILRPVSPTDVWSLILRLLPDSDELDERLLEPRGRSHSI